MRRLLPSTPFPAVLGLMLALQGTVPGPGFAHGWKHSTVYVSSAPVTTVAPVYSMSVHVATVAPAYVAPMVSLPVMAMPVHYSVPTYTYPAPAAAAAPAYYMAAPTYYTAAPASPYLPAAQSVPQTANLPVAPISFLSSFNPDAPMVPGTPGYDPAMPHAKGSRILQALRNAIFTNRNMVFGSLVQLAANLFGQEFGFSPNAQDSSLLSGLVSKILDETNGSSSSVSNPPPVPGGNQAPQTLVITVTLPSDSRISIQQGGQQTGQQPPRPGTNPTGTSGGPGNP